MGPPLFMSYLFYVKQIFGREKIVRYIIFACIPALLFYSLSLVILSRFGFETMQILRDPAQQSGASSFLGFLSNIGVWLWVSSAAICFFSVLSNRTVTNNGGSELLSLAGALSIILALDDFFMIHDRYISQWICYLVYVVFATALLARHYKKIIEVDGFAFLLAGCLLASSISTDFSQRFTSINYESLQLFEEGFKFVGGATWLYFVYRIASFQSLPAKE